MFSTTKMLFRCGSLNLVSLNQFAITPLSATTVLTQSCRFASSSTSNKKSNTKSACNKKSTKSTKSKSKRKTASKSGSAASTASKKRKQAKSKVKEVKAKSFIETLNKSDKKLLSKYPDPAQPKRPLNAFSRYVQTQSDTKLVDAAKLWNELDESRKNEYKNEFKSEFVQYQEKYNDYKQIRDKSVEEWLHVIKQLQNDKPPKSGYVGFISENKSLFSGQTVPQSSQKIKDLASQWQNMTSYEKESYNNKYSQLYSEWKERVKSYYHQH